MLATTKKRNHSKFFFIPNVSKLAEFACKMHHKVKHDKYLNREVPRELQLLQHPPHYNLPSTTT